MKRALAQDGDLAQMGWASAVSAAMPLEASGPKAQLARLHLAASQATRAVQGTVQDLRLVREAGLAATPQSVACLPAGAQGRLPW